MNEYPVCPCNGLLSDCPLCRGAGKLDCLCRGLGYVARLRSREGSLEWEVTSCPRCGSQRRQAVTLPSGLSTQMEEWTFDAIYQDLPRLKAISEKVEAWAIGQQGWYVFSAEYGRGKTYLSAALVNWYWAQGLEAMYWVSKSLLQRLHDANWGEDPDWTLGALHRVLATVPLLCLDEFGHEELTAWQEAQVRAVLVARSDGYWLPTTFSTNKSFSYFEKHMPWLVSRWQGATTTMESFEGVDDLRPRLKREEKATL